MTSSFDGLPIWATAIILILLMVTAFVLGQWFRHRRGETESEQEGLLISAVLGLLALLMGFTFALAVDRFENRRLLVVDEANAIRTAYMQAQTFNEPDRGELSTLIAGYMDNRLALGRASERDQAASLAAQGEAMRGAMWTATVGAVNKQRDDISSTFMGSMSGLMEVSAARSAEREAHVPRRVFVVLLVYILVATGGLGLIFGSRYRAAVAIVLVLAAMSYLLIVDIDSATAGGVRESQQPMEALKDAAGRQPPAEPPAPVKP
jgi:uncharacterized protein YqgC (DUF456 family)